MIKWFIYILILLNILAYADTQADARNSANNLGNTAISKFGSKDGISQNISTPMQTSTQLKTLDNSKSFSTNIKSCAENENGIKITFNSGGDSILNITINQDLDANGTYDYAYAINNIATLCSGGYKTTDNKSYKYTFNTSTKQLSSSLDSSSNMGTCYCILNSCNYGGYKKDIADKIAGDIIGTIGSSNIANYSVGINNYDSTSKTYNLFIKNNTGCNDKNMGNTYTNTNPKDYYSSQTIPTINIGDVAAKDNNKSDSLYFITKNQNNVIINTSGTSNTISNDDLKVCVSKKIPYTDLNGSIKINNLDNCTNYNNSCTLLRDEICDSNGRNCIDRVLNGSLTSNSIPIKCLNYTSDTQVCSNGNQIYGIGSLGGNYYVSSGNSYFYSKKTFNCGNTSSSYDASKSSQTYQSVSKSGGNINYKSFDGSSQTINVGNFDNCIVRYCSYKKTSDATTVYTDNTNKSNSTTSTNTNELLYKQCGQLASGSYTCPLNSGETMIENCSCNLGMNGAATALGYASAIEDAVQDFTCSMSN